MGGLTQCQANQLESRGAGGSWTEREQDFFRVRIRSMFFAPPETSEQKFMCFFP